MNIKDIWTVAKKELKSSFSDKVILAQIFILPFMIVFGFSILISVMGNAQSLEDTSKVNAYYINAPMEMETGLEAFGLEAASLEQADTFRQEVEDKKCDLLIVFPENFVVAQAGTENLSNIDIWYNSSESRSVMLYSRVTEYLNTFQPTVFTINASTDIKYDLGSETDMFRSMLGMILPLFLLMAVFMVCMNLAAESIAGDKERGFLNTMLIAPVKRSDIAAGKSLCIFITAMIGGLSAFIGMAVSLPIIAKAVGIKEGISYRISEYILLFAVTITAVFVLTGILLIFSTLAKDVKQATNIAPTFMIVLMVACMLTMTDSVKQTVEQLGMVNAFIPAWNSLTIMRNIMEHDYSFLFVIVSCVVNLLFLAVAVFIVGRCFENERIVNE